MNHRIVLGNNHVAVELFGSASDIVRLLALDKERVIVVVISRNYLDWLWIVQLVVVIRAGLPVVAVIVAPEAVVVVVGKSNIHFAEKGKWVNKILLKHCIDDILELNHVN